MQYEMGFKKKDKGWSKKKKVIFFSSFAFIFFMLGAMYMISENTFGYKTSIEKMLGDYGFVSASTDSTNWTRKALLTINSSFVDSNLTDFPVLLTNANLPQEMWNTTHEDAKYNALFTGCDIRFTTNSSGEIEIPFELVDWTQDDSTGSEIWIKLNISNETDIEFYVWYDNSVASCYVINDTYGAEKVWDSNFKVVQHMGNATTSTITDSTTNDNDGTKAAAGDPAETSTAQIGLEAQDFDGDDDYIDIGDVAALEIDTFTISTWAKRAGIDDQDTFLSMQYQSAAVPGLCGTTFRFNSDNTLGLASTISNTFEEVISTPTYTSTSDFYYVVARKTGTTVTLYIDGSLVKTGTLSSASIDWTTSVTKHTVIGARWNGRASAWVGEFEGILDEVRISNSARSADWISAEYNNQNSPSTFIVEGTPASTGDRSPTYSNNQTNTTIGGQSILFSLLIDDNNVLHPNGQYIFGTNNSGTWVNDSAINFTGTPQWANITKTLNNTVGLTIGYRWYINDDTKNINNTEIFTLTTISTPDTISPTIVRLNQTNSTGIINGSVIQDENVTFIVNATDETEVDSVWVTIWTGVVGGPIWLIQQLVDLGSNIWEGNVTTNTSLTAGDVNYTISVNDTSGNEINESSNFTLIASDTCTCPGIDTSWEIDMSDYCILSTPCDLGTGNLTFTGEGNFTCSARLDIASRGKPGNNSILWFDNDCEVYIG